ncbi:MAG: DNA-binding protein [Deltaproteobacteria bacterium]|nr:DNA-binding protein [Deltaproteobacteria bacterium]
MPACNIIVDSCSYFRLARSIRPLLKTPFGKKKYCLGVIQELDKEYEKSPTLKNKFFWVLQQEYSDNRKECFSPKAKQRSEINHAFFFIRDFARENQSSVSEVDITGLAYAYVLKIPVVTDDSDMLEIAKEYEIKTYKTLELMKLMMDSGLVRMELIKSIVSYWSYQNDEPKSFRKDFKRIFSEEPPE